jgi:membrane-bound ClpP family serine protease
MNWVPIVVLIVAGLVLLALDFYVPGFVLASIGAVLMVIALMLGYRSYGVGVMLALLGGEIVLGGAVMYGAIRLFPQSPLGRKMILAKTQTGVRAQTQRESDLVGREGVAHTLLRPTGVALVDGKRLDVVADSGMIEAGSPIKIVAVAENRIVVRKA